MVKTITFLFLSLITTVTFAAGQATHNKDFVLNGNVDTIVAWLQKNPEEVARSTHSTVVSRNGDTTRVRKQTAKGMYEFTVKESITKSGTSYIYESNLVQSHVGDLESQSIRVTLSEAKRGGTSVKVYMHAKTGERNIRNADVKLSLIKSCRGFEGLLKNQFK